MRGGVPAFSCLPVRRLILTATSKGDIVSANAVKSLDVRGIRPYEESSRIEPVFEMNLETLEHLFFNVFDVGELAPTSHVRSLFLPVLGS